MTPYEIFNIYTFLLANIIKWDIPRQKFLNSLMSVVLQNFYLNVDYLEILAIYDILAVQVSGKFCIDLTRLLVQVAVEQDEQMRETRGQL